MAYPTTDWPGSVDATLTRTNGVDIVYANEFNYPDAQIRTIQGWLGVNGDYLGDSGTAAHGPGGVASPIADSGTAFTIAAKNDFTSGKLLSIGDDYDSSYSEKAYFDYAGKLTAPGLTLSTGTAVTTILDEDAMGSDSATALATQQSIKAYVDGATGAGTDTTAIHTDGAGEIAGLSGPYGMSTNDVLVAEDTGSGNVKFKVTLATLMNTDSQITATGGSSTPAAPSFAFFGYTHTGMYFARYPHIGGNMGTLFASWGNLVGYFYDGGLAVHGASGTQRNLTIFRDGTNADIGGMYFRSDDSGGTVSDYGYISGHIVSSTAGSESGKIEVSVADGVDGSVDQVAEFAIQGVGFTGGSAASPGLYVIGDTDTGVCTGGANTLDIATSGNTRVSVSADGALGDPGFYNNKQTVTSSSNEINVDCQDGHIVYHALTENTEVQAPTNEVGGAILTFIVKGGASSYTFSVAAFGSGEFGFSSSYPITVTSLQTLTAQFVYDQTNDIWLELNTSLNTTGVA